MKQFQVALSIFLTIAFARLVPAQTQFNPYPSRAFGQAILQQIGLPTVVAPNLAEGRELNFPQAVAVDTSASPPILYVADSSNNRVLAWKNAVGFTKGDKADKVIGQRDFLMTQPKGPGTDLSTGLSLPNALVVDKNGNLYVADAGNNRVLRFPKPFQQTGDLLLVDLVIGQKDQNSRAANEGLAAPTEKTIALSTGGGVFRSGLAFDASGNLWFSDAGNNRVLRYRSDLLGSIASNEPAADIVLGQQDFTTNSLPPNSFRNTKNFLSQPSGLAFDPKGRLFVPDASNRVVVFEPPFASGNQAARIMGIVVAQPGGPPPPALNETTLGAVINGNFVPPEGVFFVGNNPWVVDTGNSRIVKFDPYESWPAESTTFSPPGIAVIGQPDLTSSTSNKANRGQPQSSNVTLANPVAGVFVGNDMYVVDAGNNRVLDFPLQSGTNFFNATRLLGQLDFQYNSPNLIEGRELWLSNGVQSGNIVIG
jgi:sugar lactone lactonase YvrE